MRKLKSICSDPLTRNFLLTSPAWNLTHTFREAFDGPERHTDSLKVRGNLQDDYFGSLPL